MATYIDIFAGCGGISTGLYNSGQWHGLFAIEKSSDAFMTLHHNLINEKNHFSWPDWLEMKEHDINDVLDKHSENLAKLKGKVDLVVGGPPCQGFSLAGRRNESDARNSLIKSYLKFVSLVQPKMVLFENVKGFGVGFKRKDATRSQAYSEIVLSQLKALGYKYINYRIVDFSQFGLPQRRERYIIVASRVKKIDFFKEMTDVRDNFLKSNNLTMETSVQDAISDLLMSHGTMDSPDTKGFNAGKYGNCVSNYQRYMRKNSKRSTPDSHRFARHTNSVLDKFQKIVSLRLTSDEIRKSFPSKKNCVTLLNPSKQSPTITTLPDDYIHYKEPRILTVREYARLQSFPDWFEFKGKYTTGGERRKIDVPRYSQIGNAIPPLFGEQCGYALRNLL